MMKNLGKKQPETRCHLVLTTSLDYKIDSPSENRSILVFTLSIFFADT